MDDTKRIAPSGQATCFRGPNGQELVLDGSLAYYNPDGELFWELYVEDPSEQSGSLHDPRKGQWYRWSRNHAELFLDGVRFQKAALTIDLITVVPLPREDRARHLFRVANGDLVGVTGNRFNPDDAFRVWIGARELREVAVTEVTAGPDGMLVATDENRLLIPWSPWDGVAPAWGDEEIGWLNVNEFDFDFGDDRELTVSRHQDLGFAAREAGRLLAGWHRVDMNETAVWFRERSDREYAAIGEWHAYVQVWVPGGESVVFRDHDAAALMRHAEPEPWRAAMRELALRIDAGALQGAVNISATARELDSDAVTLKRALDALSKWGSPDGLPPWEPPRVRVEPSGRRFIVERPGTAG